MTWKWTDVIIEDHEVNKLLRLTLKLHFFANVTRQIASKADKSTIIDSKLYLFLELNLVIGFFFKEISLSFEQLQCA